MIKIRRFNESDWVDKVYHTSEVTKEDIEDLEDHFVDIKDEWLMAPYVWTHSLKAPKGFNFEDYKFYYSFNLPFNDKIALTRVGYKSMWDCNL